MIINKKIVFLGYMGSGKSSIAKLISKKLDLINVDLDNYIEKKKINQYVIFLKLVVNYILGK